MHVAPRALNTRPTGRWNPVFHIVTF